MVGSFTTGRITVLSELEFPTAAAATSASGLAGLRLVERQLMQVS
jgi:hypothetical protein